MSYTILRPATHEEWLEEGKKGIGSSDAGTIMGAPFPDSVRAVPAEDREHRRHNIRG